MRLKAHSKKYNNNIRSRIDCSKCPKSSEKASQLILIHSCKYSPPKRRLQRELQDIEKIPFLYSPTPFI
jgi:hypothetical protein